MADLGEIRAKLVAETSDFEAGMARAADATSEFSGTAEANIDAVNKSLKSINWREAGQSIAQMGGALKGIGDDFLQAASAADDLADKLKGAFGDSADQVAQWSQDIGTKFQVFSAEQVGGAATALQKFGQASEENLRRVADVAAGSGQSIESVAEAFGKFEKFGDSKSILGLQKAIGATAAELGNFGAVLDSSGKILADTPARADAAKDAMERFLDDKYAGAMERQSDASSQLAGSLELLKQELGASALEAKENMAPALLDIVERFREMSPEIKGAIGLITEYGGTALQVGGQGLQMAANLSTLGLSMTGIKTAMMAVAGAGSSMVTGFLAMGGPIGILIVSLGALAVGLAATLAEMEKANKAAEDLLSLEEKRARNLAKHKDLIGKSTAELKAMGATAKDVDELIAGMRDSMEGASEEQKSKTRVQIEALRNSRNELPRGDAVSPAGVKNPGTPRVEESEKQKAAREKKEASAKAKADKAAETARKKREAADLAAKKAAERKRLQDEAKRNRERTAADKAADRKRSAAEKARAREQAKQEKERQKQAAAAKPPKPTAAKTAAAAETAAAVAVVPGFFDKFAQDDSTKAFKEIAARNAERAKSEVFLSDTPSQMRGGAIGNVLKGLTVASSAINPAAAAAVAGAQGATKGTAPASAEEVGGAVGDAFKEGIAVTLTVNEGGKTTTQTETASPGKPAKFHHGPRMGGVTG